MSNKDTGTNINIPWPPKSPADVLLLTPKKDRSAAAATITSVPGSPSPMRRRIPTSPSPRKGRDKLDDDEDMDMLTDDDEDEEMLQLKLARIEAKLKLKQLQRKRKRANSVTEEVAAAAGGLTGSGNNVNGGTIGAVPGLETHGHMRSRSDITSTSTGTSTTATEARPSTSRPGYGRATTPVSQIQVAASPQKQPPPSPSRILLGIDRGLRAKDVSLKRAPQLRLGATAPPGAGGGGISRPSTSTSSQGTSIFTSHDPFSSRPTTSTTTTSISLGREPSPTRPTAKTFNQRIAEARAAENEMKAKQAAIEGSRSKGFGVSAEETNSGSTASIQGSSGAQLSSLEAARLSGGSGGGGLGIDIGTPKPSIWTSTSTSGPPRPVSFHGFDAPKSINPSTSSLTTDHPITSTSTTTTTTTTATSGVGYDTFSQLHLSNRTLPHTTLSRALQQKTIYLLPDLLKTIVSPTYDPPDIEGDWVVMGIISSKSEPRQTLKSQSQSQSKPTSDANNPNPGGDKYMVLTLTDLKWDVEVFLFGSGFDRWWKVGVGTVVAILNPGVMRPRNPDSGKFSLTINSRDDVVLEVGTARDLGFCKSVKKDGKMCGMWVDKRRMEYCGFHIELAVKKSTNQRMELNNMGKLFSPPRKGAVRPASRFLHRGGTSSATRLFPSSSGGGGGNSGSFRDDGLLPADNALPDLPQRLGGAGGKVFVYPSTRTTSSTLFDDTYQDAFHNGTREERLKRQLAKSEREREVARKLVAAQRQVGGGLVSTGAEYLRRQLEEEEERKKREVMSGTGAGGSEAVEKVGTTMKSLGLSRGRVVRNNEDYISLGLTNRTTSTTQIHLSPIKRSSISNSRLPPLPIITTSRTSTRRNIPSTASTKASTSTSEESGPKKKKTKVHFNRPVVTGGGYAEVNGEDEDDDLDII